MLSRFRVSTAAGETLDSAIFLTAAFLGTAPLPILAGMIPVHAGVKILYEVMFSPLSAALACALKHVEGIDAFDVGVRFNPFLVTE